MTSKAFFVFGFLYCWILLFPVSVLNAQNSSDYEQQVEELFDRAYGNLSADNKDSAQYYFHKIKTLSTKRSDWINVIDAVLGLNQIAKENNELGRVKNYLDNLDSLFISNQSYLDTIPGILLYRNDLSHQNGNYYFLIHDFERSRNAFQNIISTTEHLPDSLFTGDYSGNTSYLSTAYSYLAKMYSDEGKLDLAQQYYEKNIRFLTEKDPNDVQRLYGNYSLLAEVYNRQNNYKSANIYLMKTLDFNLKNRNASSIASILNIAQNHIKLSQLDSAFVYLNKVKSILEVNDPEMPSYFQVSAELNQANDNYGSALNAFNKALELTKKNWNHKKHWEVAHVLNKIGLLQKQFRYFDKAIQSYDEAIAQLHGPTSTINQTTLLEILRNKAEALNYLKNANAYALTISSVNQGIEILSILKPSFKSQADKLLLIEEAFPLLEAGLGAAYELYQTSKEEQFIELAFQYSEQSKAVLLMEALLGARATKFANFPPELLEQENQLKSEIAITERRINNAKEMNAVLEDELFFLKEEHRQLVRKIENDYKAYYDLKYNNETISIDQMQLLLGDDEQLISFFYGNDAIYTIAIDKQDQRIERVEIHATMEKDIKKIYEMLRDPNSDMTVLNKISFQFYKRLLSTCMKPNEKRKLIIIPDGLLNYIPFTALNTKADGITYLTESFSVSYSNSATLLSQLRQRHPIDKNILAFAPSFNRNRNTDTDQALLLPLPNNKKEVEEILTSFHGLSFMGNAASLQNFKAELGNYGIVHLATHAIFDDASPEDSYLAFAPKENEENLLYVRDLYNLRTDADMVTLSACESGVGELRRGEGLLSLARGFFYSGASSICSTLWKINDASSTQLMDSFYKNLAEGDAKDLALQKAQIQFLNTNRQNALAHPYYWSGFVLSGNTEPVVHKNRWWWIVWGGVSLLVLGFIIIAIQKRNRTNFEK